MDTPFQAASQSNRIYKQINTNKNSLKIHDRKVVKYDYQWYQIIFFDFEISTIQHKSLTWNPLR
jgi:hypothetical protein